MPAAIPNALDVMGRNRGIRLGRRFPRPASGMRASRPSGGKCEPRAFWRCGKNPLSRRQKKRRHRKWVSRQLPAAIPNALGVMGRNRGIRLGRRFPRPASGMQASRPSGGKCEPRAFWRCGENPLSRCQKKEKTPQMGVFSFWQRNRDSNPNIQSQSLLCYRYTIPLSLFSLISIAQRKSFVKGIFKKYSAFF